MENIKEQHELYENARKRVKQKKWLYYHFVLFLVSSLFFIILNKVLNIGTQYIQNWFVWVILIWLFFLILHFINVFITHPFMGKKWERTQTEKLIKKQEIKIAQLEQKIEKRFVSESEKKDIGALNKNINSPNKPQ